MEELREKRELLMNEGILKDSKGKKYGRVFRMKNPKYLESIGIDVNTSKALSKLYVKDCYIIRIDNIPIVNKSIDYRIIDFFVDIFRNYEKYNDSIIIASCSLSVDNTHKLSLMLDAILGFIKLPFIMAPYVNACVLGNNIGDELSRYREKEFHDEISPLLANDVLLLMVHLKKTDRDVTSLVKSYSTHIINICQDNYDKVDNISDIDFDTYKTVKMSPYVENPELEYLTFIESLEYDFIPTFNDFILQQYCDFT